MTPTASRRLSVNRKRLLWQASTLLAILLLARFLWMRSQPERLTKVSFFSRDYTVYGGIKIGGDSIYIPVYPGALGMQGTGAPGILALSLHDDEMRTVVTESPQVRFYSETLFSTLDGALNYAIEPCPKSDPLPYYGAASGTPDIAGPFLGTFLPPQSRSANAEASGYKRVAQRQRPFPTEDTRFRQVSLQGGTPRDMLALCGENFCLVGSHVFWIRPRPEKCDRILSGRIHWTEVTAHSDLMLTSLTDGATRCLRTGVSRSVPLVAGDSGILFAQPMPFPNKPTLLYARVADGSVRALGIAPEGWTAGRPLEFGGRLYWTVTSHHPESDGSYLATLMSANPDGTDRREVLAELDKHPVGNLSLHVYQDRLYCFLDKMPLASEEDSTRLPYLCRLHPERTDPIEIVRRLPASSSAYQFSGGSLYFVLREHSLWTALTDNSGALSEDTLCRVPLK